MDEKILHLLQQMSLVISYMAQHATDLTDDQLLAVSDTLPAWHVGVDYTPGMVVRHDGQLYRCAQAHTSQAEWAPDASPALWFPISYSEDGTEQWRQPTGAHDAYNVGDTVEHNGKKWRSLINGNTWEPSDDVPTLWAVVD